MSKILQLKNLAVSYGAIAALKGVDIDIEEGTITALLGANGAGKSTILRTISGVVKPSGGEILFRGVNIAGKEPYRIAGLGIIQSPEGRLILSGLTVEENLMVGAYSLKKGDITIIDENEEKQVVRMSVKQQIDYNFNRIYRYFPILKERKKQQANTLSGGEQQMLAIGRALMASPKILLLDEPSLGLAPLIVRDIFKIIDQIRREGNTILIVEQNAYQTLKIADYAYVLELGKVSISGKGSDLLQDDRLVEAYLGDKR